MQTLHQNLIHNNHHNQKFSKMGQHNCSQSKDNIQTEIVNGEVFISLSEMRRYFGYDHATETSRYSHKQLEKKRKRLKAILDKRSLELKQLKLRMQK